MENKNEGGRSPLLRQTLDTRAEGQAARGAFGGQPLNLGVCISEFEGTLLSGLF